MSAFTSQGLLAALTAPVQRVLRDVEQVLGMEVEARDAEPREEERGTGRLPDAVAGQGVPVAPGPVSAPLMVRPEGGRVDLGQGSVEPAPVPRIVLRREGAGRASKPVGRTEAVTSRPPAPPPVSTSQAPSGFEVGAPASSSSQGRASEPLPRFEGTSPSLHAPIAHRMMTSSASVEGVPSVIPNTGEAPPAPGLPLRSWVPPAIGAETPVVADMPLAARAVISPLPASSEAGAPRASHLPRLVLSRKAPGHSGLPLATPAVPSGSPEPPMPTVIPSGAHPAPSVQPSEARGPGLPLAMGVPHRMEVRGAPEPRSVSPEASHLSRLVLSRKAPGHSGLPLATPAVPSGSPEPPMPTVTPPGAHPTPFVLPSEARSPGLPLAASIPREVRGATEPRSVTSPRPAAVVAPPPAVPAERLLLPDEAPPPPSQGEAMAFDRERLTEALVDILQDAARREGLEV